MVGHIARWLRDEEASGPPVQLAIVRSRLSAYLLVRLFTCFYYAAELSRTGSSGATG